VYSVEQVGCDAMAQSLERGERVVVPPGPTLADGLKPVEVGALNFAIARRHVSGSFRVDDDSIGRALASLLAYAKLVVEPSGAAALAPALERRLPNAPRHLGVILSGGNIGLRDLADLLRRFAPFPRPLGRRDGAGSLPS
jgi:threonine dehydratase